MRRVLLINPPIHDFAAYDFWAKPLGLMIVGSALKQAGFAVDFLDFVDPCSPWLPDKFRPKRKPGGHGKFHRLRLPRPDMLPGIGRRFSRYGLPPVFAERAIKALPRPDAVLVTSMMTYWYTGVQEAIALARQAFPGVPVILGGVYAGLCTEHATAHSGADHVLPGPIETQLSPLFELIGASAESIHEPFVPAYHLAPYADSAAIMTSRGCPFRCLYCGVKALAPEFVKHEPVRVVADVQAVAAQGVHDLAIYDDALLIDADRAVEVLSRIAALCLPLRFHAASGLSLRGLSPKVAAAMKAAGFETVRLGLETNNPNRQRELGGKASCDEFDAAVENLLSAGFSRDRIGVYVLAALPGQSIDEIRGAVEFVLDRKLRPHLSEYSPVPKSPMFSVAQHESYYDLDEPLFHNPTLLPCAGPGVTHETINRLKLDIRERTKRLEREQKI